MSSNDIRAFPGPDQATCENDIHQGMTLRDYFAAKAMQAIVSNTETLERMEHGANENMISPDVLVATGAYGIADAMLAERNK